MAVAAAAEAVADVSERAVAAVQVVVAAVIGAEKGYQNTLMSAIGYWFTSQVSP